MDLTEAFMNDPYDWEGPHEPIVDATEADMDGALTMEIFKLLSSSPGLFGDVRHYNAKTTCRYLNSGTHATFFAAHSGDPAVNLEKVELLSGGFHFPAGGASVSSIRRPGHGDDRPARAPRRKILAGHRPGRVPTSGESRGAGRPNRQTEWPHDLRPAGGTRRRVLVDV